MITAHAPRGYRQSTKTGLVLPEDLSRDREVWTRDEWKLIERVTKFLTSRGIVFQFACEECRGAKMEMRVNRADGSGVLRCGHKDRIWSRHV